MKKKVRRILPRNARTACIAGTVVALALLLLFRGCGRKPGKLPHPSLVLVTGYCNCGICCGWRRSWFGFGVPVYTYGRMRGQPKTVGVTARGTKARHGTIAADPEVFPFGVKLSVPGYGTGIVEDVGGKIKDRHIDIWFPTHQEAAAWGCRRLNVQEVK